MREPGAAARALGAVLALLLMPALAACGGQPPPATPTAAVPSLVVSYDSPALGYRLQLPAGYRRSECLSVWQSQPPAFPTDIFTPLSAAEERAQERGHVAGGGPVAARVVAVTVSNAEGKTALDWAKDYGSFGGAEKHEPRTIAGHEAIRTVVSGMAVLYVVRADQRLLVLSTTLGSLVPDGVLDAIAATVEVGSTQPLTAPTAGPTTITPSAHDAAMRIAAALERSDASAAALLVTPRCWMETWSAVGGPIGRPVQPFVTELGARFRSGLRISVDPTLQVASRAGPSGLRLYVSSRWSQAGRVTAANVYLREIDAQWYWGGVETVALPGP